MPQGFSGIRTETPQNLVLDAGVAYANIDVDELETSGWSEAITGAQNLGATRGGASFDLNRQLREIEVNGALGPVDQLIRRQEIRPTLSVTLLEMTADNLLKAVAGGQMVEVPDTTPEYERISGGEITSASFLDNIALATRLQGSTDNKPIVFVLYNAMVHTSPPMSAEEQNEMGIECEFVGHFPLESPQDEATVWRIYRPITTSP